MKLTGIQYYWLIFVGLMLALALSTYEFSENFNEKIISNPILLVLLVILSLYALVCFYAAVFEIWELYMYKLIIVVILIFIAGEYIHSSLFVLYEISPTAYWLWRINGVKNN